MALEIKIDEKQAYIELLSKEGNNYKINLNGKIFDVDLVMVERGVYSVLYKNKSYNVEIAKGRNIKEYIVNTFYNTFDISIIDAEARYMKNRRGDHLDDDSCISSPMPGKVVKVPVKVGQQVKAGDTVIIISAMKMESEYKVKKDRKIKKILVKEGDTIDGNQPLIVIE